MMPQLLFSSNGSEGYDTNYPDIPDYTGVSYRILYTNRIVLKKDSVYWGSAGFVRNSASWQSHAVYIADATTNEVIYHSAIISSSTTATIPFCFKCTKDISSAKLVTAVWGNIRDITMTKTLWEFNGI